MTTTNANYWAVSLGELLTGTLPKDDYNRFESSMKQIYKYVRDKNEGRCTSKKIKDGATRQLLYGKLFDLYVKDPNYTELCRSKLMRKLVKHNRDNDNNLTYIEKAILTPSMKSMNIPEDKQSDLALKLWLRDLYATVMDPATLETQKALTGNLPEDYAKKLTDGRVAIGMEMREAVNNKWLTPSVLLEVVRLIELEEWPKEDNISIEFTKEGIVDYLAKFYRGLIKTGGEYASTFKASLVTGLRQFANDPAVIANAPKKKVN